MRPLLHLLNKLLACIHYSIGSNQQPILFFLYWQTSHSTGIHLFYFNHMIRSHADCSSMHNTARQNYLYIIKLFIRKCVCRCYRNASIMCYIFLHRRKCECIGQLQLMIYTQCTRSQGPLFLKLRSPLGILGRLPTQPTLKAPSVATSLFSAYLALGYAFRCKN